MKGELQRRLGANLRTHRRALGLTQEKLAELWGMHPKYYGKVERGQCNVTLQTLEHLADMVGESEPARLLFPQP